jgi:hypothetical protein
MPPLRLLAFALSVAVCPIGSAAAATAETTPDPVRAAMAAAINFFLARGEADECGPGCNEWIAAEGKIDAGAAQRLRRLLTKLGSRRPPIYFNSPGGSIVGSLELGRLIRDRKLTASVAHTIPRSCERDKSFEKSCEAQKRSGQELESEFDLDATMCNSACVYAVAGGAVRPIPPWVKLGIHDLGFDPDSPPPRALIAEARRVAHGRIQQYLRDMGMDDALFEAAAAVPFESLRFLEREELVRFGIDRREFGETPWQFVNEATPSMRKRFFLRSDQARYVDGLLRLDCGTGQAIRLVLAWPHDASAVAVTGPRLAGISLSGQRLDLSNTYTAKDIDFRSASVPAGRFDAVDDNATIGLSNEPARPDASATLNMRGFSVAYAKLRNSCDERARNTMAAASPPFVSPAMAPPAMPVPYFGVGVPGALTSPAVQGWPGAQNRGAAPPAAQPVPARSASRAADSPTQSEPVPSEPEPSEPVPSEPVQEACNLHIADEPQHLTGRVTGLLSGEEVMTRTQRVEAELGGQVSPAYVSLKRVRVERYPPAGNWSTMAAIPEHMAVKIGDLVELNGRHQDESLRCHFIPWTINRVVGHAE